MNRYSLLFAVLVASSFAVHPTQAGDGASSAATSQTSATEKEKAGEKLTGVGGGKGLLVDDPVKFVKKFVEKAAPDAKATQNLQILFATEPHPVETHLASEFDHNVDALVDGLTDAGYLFDSSLILWSVHGSRDQFDDDMKEKIAKSQEDDIPGILLFRKKSDTTQKPKDPYANGLIVFLFTDTPTGGIAREQAQNAVKILGLCGISMGREMRILGPAFSGSFASLVPVVGDLLKAGKQTERIIVRSGGVSVSSAAEEAVQRMRALWNIDIDFGSAAHDNADSIRTAVGTLGRIGIDKSSTAILSEGESLYGGSFTDETKCPDGGPEKPGGCVGKDGRPEDTGVTWSLDFPRDISSLRAGYEKQGIFDTTAPALPWKRFLNLTDDDQSEADSVHSFGGAATQAAQESVLFGISEFLHAHDIRAVIVSATNEEDRYFLTQFLHAHNADVRVVVIGNTRIFMRGSTAQFRGDMMVDDFPMMPRLHDWTGTASDRDAPIFADAVAEGTYFAALDLFAEPTEPVLAPQTSGAAPHILGRQFKWYPEYSAPNWGTNSASEQRPPMYVVALGSNATWPVAEDPGTPLDNYPALGRVGMPFVLFAHDLPIKTQPRPSARPINVAFSWKILFLMVTVSAALYCLFFWYANPVSRVVFASFAPSLEWRFWLFKVAIPAAVAGSAFRVLAWSVEMPFSASPQAAWWWRLAESFTLLAPLAIAVSPLIKALVQAKFVWCIWMGLSFAPAALAAICLAFTRFLAHDLFATRDAGLILNTYRRMHWESGLSLIPTVLLFLSAIMVWASQAGNGAALLDAAPSLPHFFNNGRISQKRAVAIQSIGYPLPFNWQARWLWIVWSAFAGLLLWAHFYFHPFVNITTLESYTATCIVRGAAGVLGALIFLDVFQFFWFWAELRGLLQALDREEFKRGFVPIHNFNWRNLLSVTGTSLSDRRAILRAQVDCVYNLREERRFAGLATLLETLQNKYGRADLSDIDNKTYRNDLRQGYRAMAVAAHAAFALIESRKKAAAQPEISPGSEAIQRVLVCQCKGDGGRFSDEAEELARLPKSQQTAEKLICLMYIGFIQTIVARLHTLLISVASMFSLATLGIAIYPFAPFSPLLIAGLAFMVLIGCAFFKVFSEMDTDPILSRIVNGDDRKLQGNFYMRFAEAIALPLLALGSSVLPGGAGRLLELAQSLFNHAQ
jgi:hypothetical protein